MCEGTSAFTAEDDDAERERYRSVGRLEKVAECVLVLVIDPGSGPSFLYAFLRSSWLHSARIRTISSRCRLRRLSALARPTRANAVVVLRGLMLTGGQSLESEKPILAKGRNRSRHRRAEGTTAIESEETVASPFVPDNPDRASNCFRTNAPGSELFIRVQPAKSSPGAQRLPQAPALRNEASGLSSHSARLAQFGIDVDDVDASSNRT
jgi:hypothetical protein